MTNHHLRQALTSLFVFILTLLSCLSCSFIDDKLQGSGEVMVVEDIFLNLKQNGRVSITLETLDGKAVTLFQEGILE